VKAGQLNVQHYETEPYHSIQGWPNPQPVDLTTLPVVPMTKKNLYREAQWTAPIVRHRHHRCNDKSSKDLIRNAKRQELEARKVARGLNSRGRSWDYSGLEAQFLDDYLKERWDDGDGGSRDDVFEIWDYEREGEGDGVCRCDDCVWDRHTWVPSEGDEEVYEGVGTKEPEDDEKDESAAWFEALFDQTSQLIVTKTPLEEDTEEWAGWFVMLFDQTSELVGTKTPTEEDTDQWADWFDTLFDQTSQLVDAALEKRNILAQKKIVKKRNALVQKEVEELGWVDAIADTDEASDMDWNTASWFDLLDPEWTDYWPSVTKTESESSFEMV
jgi:hypothetical protein